MLYVFFEGCMNSLNCGNFLLYKHDAYLFLFYIMENIWKENSMKKNNFCRKMDMITKKNDGWNDLYKYKFEKDL
jgi:hypothetical protein